MQSINGISNAAKTEQNWKQPELEVSVRQRQLIEKTFSTQGIEQSQTAKNVFRQEDKNKGKEEHRKNGVSWCQPRFREAHKTNTSALSPPLFLLQ